MSGVGGWLLRRLLMAPLMPVLLLVMAVAWVVSLIASAVVCPVVALLSGERPRWRVLRVVSLATLYLLGETVCILVCLLLWISCGFGRWLRAAWVVRAHLAVLGGFLGALVAVARPVFGFRLQVAEPSRHPEDLLRAEEDDPLIVLARHAGPGASFALVHLLLSRYRRHPRVVLKDTLRLDPAIDLLLSRTGCTWIPSRRREGDDPAARVGRTAAGLAPRDALVLFPEGADWTPLRHLAAVARLRKRGLVREARLALRMPHVLPPRPAGAWVALQAAPEAYVLVFTHTGHDELLDLSAAWEALPLAGPLQMAWWRAPASEVPRSNQQAVQTWLELTWTDIDAWVSEQQDLAELQP